MFGLRFPNSSRLIKIREPAYAALPIKLALLEE
jgi:hypothetical protein